MYVSVSLHTAYFEDSELSLKICHFYPVLEVADFEVIFRSLLPKVGRFVFMDKRKHFFLT